MAAAHLSIPKAETLYDIWQIGWAVGGVCLLWCSRSALRRDTDGRIGWSAEPMAMIVFLVVYLVGSILVLGGLAYELAKTAAPLVAPGVEGFERAMISFMLPAFSSIFLLGLRKYAPEFSPQRPHRVKPAAEFGFTPMGLLRGFSGAMALVGAAALVSSKILWLVTLAGLGDFKPQASVKLLASNTDWRVIAPIALGAVVFAPINEELFYRGGVLAFLRNRTPRIFSYLLCGVIFSLMHMSVFAFLPLLVFGAWLAFLYDSTADIRVPVTVHACFNLSNIIWIVLAPGAVA